MSVVGLHGQKEGVGFPDEIGKIGFQRCPSTVIKGATVPDGSRPHVPSALRFVFGRCELNYSSSAHPTPTLVLPPSFFSSPHVTFVVSYTVAIAISRAQQQEETAGPRFRARSAYRYAATPRAAKYFPGFVGSTLYQADMGADADADKNSQGAEESDNDGADDYGSDCLEPKVVRRAKVDCSGGSGSRALSTRSRTQRSPNGHDGDVKKRKHSTPFRPSSEKQAVALLISDERVLSPDSKNNAGEPRGCPREDAGDEFVHETYKKKGMVAASPNKKKAGQRRWQQEQLDCVMGEFAVFLAPRDAPVPFLVGKILEMHHLTVPVASGNMRKTEILVHWYSPVAGSTAAGTPRPVAFPAHGVTPASTVSVVLSPAEEHEKASVALSLEPSQSAAPPRIEDGQPGSSVATRTEKAVALGTVASTNHESCTTPMMRPSGEISREEDAAAASAVGREDNGSDGRHSRLETDIPVLPSQNGSAIGTATATGVAATAIIAPSTPAVGSRSEGNAASTTVAVGNGYHAGAAADAATATCAAPLVGGAALSPARRLRTTAAAAVKAADDAAAYGRGRWSGDFIPRVGGRLVRDSGTEDLRAAIMVFPRLLKSNGRLPTKVREAVREAVEKAAARVAAAEVAAAPAAESAAGRRFPPAKWP